MWDGMERRQRVNPFQGRDRRIWNAQAPEMPGALVWESLKTQKVPSRTFSPSPRMSHWEALDGQDAWE